MELKLLLILILALAIAASSQSQKDFISIDCGYDGQSSYEENFTRIVYVSDNDYTDVGSNAQISAETNITGLFDFYRTVRIFPLGRRNCYTLRPLIKGRKYLIRAEFKYGNFDGLNSPPVFDLYLDTHFWNTIPRENFTRNEIIFVSSREFVQVCLVNRGTGVPYISVLEQRPLLPSMYSLVNESQALVSNVDRIDYGGEGSIRYPQDPFDRIWFGSAPAQNLLRIGTNQTINSSNLAAQEFSVPEAVLRTAVTTQADRLIFNLTGIQGNSTYIFLHFAEIQRLGNNRRREFDVYADNLLLFSRYQLNYLMPGYLYNRSSEEGMITYSLRATRNSPRRPLINAMEIHTLIQLNGLLTSENDVNAISALKSYYNINRNWQGDPCLPIDFIWEGLNCSYDGSLNPRITSLNLSNAGINGGISPVIANLTALMSLDLSNNNLTGEIPLNLGLLPVLRFLNLEDNHLSGPLPQILQEKSRNMTLLLSVDGNQIPCSSTDSCEEEKKRNTAVLAVAISIPLFIIFLLIGIFMWVVKRRRMQNFSKEITSKGLEQSANEQHEYNEKSHFFTFGEIVRITKNFEKQIGKGTSGIIYHGQLANGREVVVKMISLKSSQVPTTFLDEVEMLMRAHHKNLVSLIGYCNDQENLTVIYEFVPCGSLSMYLSDEKSNRLSWGIRLKIAFEVAQGLEYLHNFCKPPIVHGDLKSAKILLNQQFEAKLSDFGLPKLLADYNSPEIDPEHQKTPVLNENTDVYSFGIVLLELITGKLENKEESSENMNLVSWVKSRFEHDDIAAIVDQRLDGNYNPATARKTIDIAMRCTDSSSSEKTTMDDVVMELGYCMASINLNEISSCGSSPGMDSADTSPFFPHRQVNS